jgi:hypothetical protein
VAWPLKHPWSSVGGQYRRCTDCVQHASQAVRCCCIASGLGGGLLLGLDGCCLGWGVAGLLGAACLVGADGCLIHRLSIDPDKNTPTMLNRYLYDASLTAILSELPTWAQLRAYLLQQQASSFLSAAARRYHSDSQLPDTAAWPDPDCETSSEPPQPQQHCKDQLSHEGLHTHTTGGTSEVSAPNAATAKRGRPKVSAASAGGGALPGKRQRVAPVTAGPQQELPPGLQGQEGQQRHSQSQRQRQRQRRGQAAGAGAET